MTEGTRTASQPLVLVIAIAASVANAVDTTLGVGGKLDEFMSTSFQPSEGNYQFFQNHTATEPTQLTKLGPQHIRLQAVSQGVPMKVNTGAATDWNFATLDAVVQPVLSAADNSPEFQIAVAPAFLNDPTTGHFIFNSANVQAFADYSANLVRYYNKGGFTWGGTTLVSPSYPQLARAARVSGVVTVFIVVNERGEVESVERAEGPTQLQQAASDAARRWKFAPTVIDGQPVRVTGYLSFNFSL